MDDISGDQDTAHAPVLLESTVSPPVADVVLEGGGVKGLALAGAVEAMGQDGYTFARIAGTSAGAIVGSVLAGLQQRGESADRLVELAGSLDYGRVRDRGPLGRLLGPLGPLADVVSVATEGGAYEGRYLRDWVAGVLADLGVHSFGDLRIDDPGGDGQEHHRYRLVVVVSDLTRRRAIFLPWDYATYGLDPDEQSVADAVRASASTPYLFEPSELTGPYGTATLVDGGLVSNYPIGAFDREDGRPARWPTIGVRLDSYADPARVGELRAVAGPVRLGVSLVETAIEGSQSEVVLEPRNLARSISVDTTEVSSLDFDLSAQQRERLISDGRSAARRFLRTWDYATWVETYAGGGPVTGGPSGR